MARTAHAQLWAGAGRSAQLPRSAVRSRMEESHRPRSALGPCRNGPARASAVADGPEEPQVAGPPAHAAGMMQTGDSDCGPEGLESLGASLWSRMRCVLAAIYDDC
jgi:hypothetical protein